nr:synaptotagmin-3-like isoform X2 [Ziziphus jujuba var. spinosa]
MSLQLMEPITSSIYELDTCALQDLLPEMPLWVKNPDYDRVDWLNKVLSDVWPYLDKPVASIIKGIAEPMFAEYIGKYQIESIEFKSISLGTLRPVICGLKVYDTNEKEIVMETAIRWAGNPDIVLVIKLLSLHITVQLVDLQISGGVRVALKPLVPTFPCFSNIVVSLMEKPDVDFGMNILGGDIMSIPGLYRYIQETVKRQVASLYHWPQTLEIPILDASSVAVKKPVGILHVKVIRAIKLLKKDILGASDPYVKLSLTGERLPSKKTTIKKKTLNPEWNEKFKLIVKDPELQVLRLQVFDWDKVGTHDRLGMQMVPLKLLVPYETKEFTLDLQKDTNISDSQDKRNRGKIEVELTFVPFKEDSIKFSSKCSGSLDSFGKRESRIDRASEEGTPGGAGLLLVMVHGAEDVEGERHNNPYASVLFKGEKKKTKMLKRTRDPLWNEEFQFMLEQPPLHEKIYIEVLSKRSGFIFPSKEPLGHVEINLTDVVHNGRINQKYHLINSKNGMIHIEIKWKTV